MISIGPRPESLKEAQQYAKTQALYRERVQKALQAVDVYSTAVKAADNSQRDLNPKKDTVALVGVSRSQLGLSDGATTGPWPALPHPGAPRDVQIVDAFLTTNGSTTTLDLQEHGGREIKWQASESKSVYTIIDKQGEFSFSRSGDVITIL